MIFLYFCLKRDYSAVSANQEVYHIFPCRVCSALRASRFSSCFLSFMVRSAGSAAPYIRSSSIFSGKIFSFKKSKVAASICGTLGANNAVRLLYSADLSMYYIDSSSLLSHLFFGTMSLCPRVLCPCAFCPLYVVHRPYFHSLEDEDVNTATLRFCHICFSAPCPCVRMSSVFVFFTLYFVHRPYFYSLYVVHRPYLNF
jgi:hypothetical protein